MTALRNFLLNSLIAMAGYCGLLFYTRSRHGSFSVQASDWWQAGGFLEALLLLVGCAVAQLSFPGMLTPKRFVTAQWLLLVPFFLTGTSAKDVYQAASALGFTGDATTSFVRTAHKASSTRGGWSDDGALEEWEAYNLIVASNCCGEWDLPDGRLLSGYEVPVNEEVFRSHAVGTSIRVVRLPGHAYPEHRLASDIESQIRLDFIWVIAWVAASLGLSLLARRLDAKESTPRDLMDA